MKQDSKIPALICAVAGLAIVLLSQGCTKSRNQTAMKNFKAGDCIRWENSELESWETDIRITKKIKEFGKKKLRYAMWFEEAKYEVNEVHQLVATPGYIERSTYTMDFAELAYYEKVTCPEDRK